MTTPPTTNAKLIAWVNEIAALCEPPGCPLVRRLPGGVRPPLQPDGRVRHLRPPQPGQAPELLPRPLAPVRRRARGGADLHLLEDQGGGRPDQQLGPARRDARHPAAHLQGLHARTDDVRHPVQHGAARLADRQDRLRDHRQPLRRLQHADHDPHGQERCSRCSATAPTSSPASTRSARRSRRARRTSRGPARRTSATSTSSTSRRPTRSGRTARATAATRCSARSAWRCGSPPAWRATRGGWPSTC